MLVLSRRLNEKILLPGIGAAVQVVAIRPGVVRLGVEAPPDVAVLREEVARRHAEWQEEPPAARPAPAGAAALDLQQVVQNRLRIAGQGLALLRQQLQDGLTTDAAITLDNLEEDLTLLRRRLEPSPAAAPVLPARPPARPEPDRPRAARRPVRFGPRRVTPPMVCVEACAG